jgi:hypothetical protein
LLKLLTRVWDVDKTSRPGVCATAAGSWQQPLEAIRAAAVKGLDQELEILANRALVAGFPDCESHPRSRWLAVLIGVWLQIA